MASCSEPIDVDEPDPEPEDDSRIVWFNQKKWAVADAIKKIRGLKNRNKDDVRSFWYRTNLIVDKDDSGFSLRCCVCEKHFKPLNPSLFWGDHNTCKDVNDRGYEYTRGADPDALLSLVCEMAPIEAGL